MLLYCFDENDLLPESQFGEIGLIDDAYLLDRFAAMLPVFFPYVQTSVDSSEEIENQGLEVIRALLRPSICDALDGAVRRTLKMASAMFLAPVQSGEAMEKSAFGHDLLDFEAALSLFSKK